MKIYTRLVLDKDDNIIEEESYEYTGPVAQCGGGGGGGGGGGFIGKIFRKIVDFVTGIVSVFKSPFGANFNSPDFNSTSSDNIQGILVNKDSAIANIPVVYGTRMVGGIRVYVSTQGGNNEYLYVAFVLAEGQCQGYTSLLIDDVVVPMSSYAHGVLATPTSGAYSTESRLQTQFFDGRDDQTVSTLLQESSANWTSDHRLRGVCYLACRFRWKKVETNEDANNNPYSGLPQIKVILQGKKIFNILGGYTAPDPADITGVLRQDTLAAAAGWTINGNSRTASKSFTLSAVSGIYYVSSGANTAGDQVLITSNENTADVKVTATITLAAANNTYADYGFDFILRSGNGTAIVGRATTTKKQLKQTDGTISDSFTHTFTNLATSGNGYRLEPGIILRAVSAGQSFTGTAKIVVEVDYPPEPAFEEHATAYGSETVTFNNNPANVLLDYMRNPRYGKGLANDTINWTSFAIAAKLCDQVVTYTASTTGKAFTCDAVLDTGASLMDNIKTILSGCRGMLPYQQGRFVMKIEHGGDEDDIAATPAIPPVVFTATNDNIIGGVTIDGDSKQTRINRCRATYVDPAADYQPNEVIFPDEGSADDIAFLAADGVRLEKNVTISTVANREQALQYAEVFVRRSRNAKIISFATNLSGANVSVGDLVQAINPLIGLNGVFRVTDVRINAEGDIEITGFEHQSSAYAIQAKPTDIVRPTLSLPNPLLVVAPTAVTAVSGAAENVATGGGYLAEDGILRRINVTWTASTDPFVRDYIVEYKLSTDATFETAGVTTRTQFHIGPVTLGSTYNIRVAARNELDRRSNFASASAHTVVA